MPIDEQALRDILARGETDRVEFKSAIPEPRSAARVLSALANTHGGLLVLGVNTEGRPVGVSRSAAADLVEKARRSLSPPPVVLVSAMVLSGRTLLLAEVERSGVAVTFEDKVFVRGEDSGRPASRSAQGEFSLALPHPEMTPASKGRLLAQYAKANAKVMGLDFSGAALPAGTSLVGSNLFGVVLAHSTLIGVLFHGCDLRAAKLLHSRMARASLRGSLLHEADLRHVDLRGVTAGRAEMHRTDLRHSNLEGADLAGADLQGALLTDAHLRGACLTGAVLRDVEVDDRTYRLSGWGAALFADVVSRGGRPVDLHKFPEEARRVLLGNWLGPGVTLTFDTRLHRFDPAAFTVLIAQVLGADTDVGVEQQSRPEVTPGFIRINGARPQDLVAVAEAFYDRLWQDTEATFEARAIQKAMSSGTALILGRLDELRDHLANVEANTNVFADDEVREAITDKAAEHVAMKIGSSLQTRFQRLASAVYEDGKKLSRASGTITAVLAVAGEVAGEIVAALEDRAAQGLEQKLIDAGLDPGRKLSGNDP